jgi:hypothetical protein
MRRPIPFMLLSFHLALLAGCDCSGPVRDACTSSSDCTGGRVCIDRMCVAPPDGGGLDAGVDARGGVDAGPPCPSAILCGSPAVCCDTGEECVEAACLPACASGVRCGADLTTCCGTGQVCISGACEDPGDACVDSFDCEDGQFCEPTLGRCLPQFDPVTCRTDPVFGPFEVTEEWSTTSATEEPDCMHGISAPVVVDLDGDRIPEVVANFACDSDWQRGILRAFRGDTGAVIWTVTDDGLELNGRTSIAAGDLTGDGRAEIVAVAEPPTARVYAFSPDGALLWRSTRVDGTAYAVTGFANGAPTIADLNEDGSPEIILGAAVLSATGVLQWEAGTGGGEGSNGTYAGGLSAVADVDLDGMPEIVSGHRAFQHDGTAFWTSPAPDGYPAIAQFDTDPQPEVALVAGGNIYLLDGMTGAIQWGPIAQPGGGIGGPPTIADFDGDGMPEIGVAGARSYSVYDPDGPMPVLWSMTTQDVSSNATGSSVFDFEGDGVAEVIYADECFMRVYRGTDGMVQLTIPSSSATIHEYPLVADVDGDGNSEILIVANNRVDPGCGAGYTGLRRGIFLYGDLRDQWMRTRRVWNEHTYHVTNVGPSGEIPMSEDDNWSAPGLNNYRQNVQGEGVYNAPDLTIVGLEVSLDRCPTMATLRARVANLGTLGVPAGVSVAFYTGTPAMRGPLLGTGTTTVPLLPGASTLVSIDVALTGSPPYAFVAVVDDDGMGVGSITECDEDNGTAAIDGLDCALVF